MADLAELLLLNPWVSTSEAFNNAGNSMKETPTDHHPGSLTRYSPGVTTIEKDDKSRMRPTDANLGSSVELPDIANEESVSFNYLKPVS